MKILLIHQYFLEDNEHGGSRFNEMTSMWLKQGHEVSVISGMAHYTSGKRKEYKGKYYVKKKQSGVIVHRCHVSNSYNSGFLGRLIGYFSFVFSSIYAGIFKIKNEHDIILVTSPPLFLGISAIILSLANRIPYVFEIRDLWPESAIDTGIIRNKWLIKFSHWFEKKIYNKAKLINVLTPAFKESLLKKNVDKEKIVCIPNGADFSLSDELLINFDSKEFRRELGFKNNFVITYVGAHGVANHLEQIVDVAELLINTNVIFQFIGEGMSKQKLIKDVNKRHLKNIIFRDPVSKKEVFKFILASDMGLSVLKKTDTFKTIYSNKTFDYMSCKKPILLCIDGVSRVLIEKANCGIYAEPENSEAIASSIRQYIGDEKRLNYEGENGYKYAKEYFDRNTLANKYIKYLENVYKK